MKTTIALLSSPLLGINLAFAALAAYPLKTCVVSGNTLGSMGTPIAKVHEGQQVKFCCEPCVEEFDENPAKFMAKLK